MTPHEIGAKIRAGEAVSDWSFDAWLPESVRERSLQYWTRVAVTMRACLWLRTCGVQTVLDVGAGAGKFCVVGALGTDMSFTGVEQRPHLIEVARSLADLYGVSQRATFVEGTLGAADFAAFDALYFYNPFGENMCVHDDRLDDTVEIGRARFERDTTLVTQLLARMPEGAFVLTYNGCGAHIPDSFELLRARPIRRNLLRLWRKTRARRAGGYWLELDESTLLRRPEGPEVMISHLREASSEVRESSEVTRRAKPIR